MEDNKNVVKSLAKNVSPKKFVPKKVKIEVDDKDKNNDAVPVSEEDEV